MILGFTGTRTESDISVERKTQILRFLIDNKNDIKYIVHGGAEGLDTFIHEVCDKLDIPKFVRPAYVKCRLPGIYQQAVPKEPLERNKDIVNECDMLLAVPRNPDKEELRSGTWHTIRYAKSLNKKIHFI
jgi:predicted Rossmann fold nucleotide-binding protein DprA/Smf involved in DNA uptake